MIIMFCFKFVVFVVFVLFVLCGGDDLFVLLVFVFVVYVFVDVVFSDGVVMVNVVVFSDFMNMGYGGLLYFLNQLVMFGLLGLMFVVCVLLCGVLLYVLLLLFVVIDM